MSKDFNNNRKNNVGKRKPEQPNRLSRLLFAFALTMFILFILGSIAEQYRRTTQEEITYSEFFQMVENNPETGEIARVELGENKVDVLLSNGEEFALNIPPNDAELIAALRENVDNFVVNQSNFFWLNILSLMWPLFILALIIWFVYRGSQAGGNRLWSFGKSRVKQGSESNVRVTFKDVAGVDEAKEELQEVIEFLKDPKKFQRLGGKIPKGVLLMGPPGTGKTLMAKAVAGEAGVPFLSISGSDFVEMFVGVGASRVRDLFEQAKKASKTSGRGSIIFIDEIDAVGRQRFAGIGGGHDEREQTLNALLVEMDGFNTQEGVILVAATNRPDVLDPALLRPGRFDRQVVIDRPDLNGREEILQVHVRNIKLDKDIDLMAIARQTPGFSGADIANLVNEAALLAARRNKNFVTTVEMQDAIERVIAGPERKSRVIHKNEKIIVAYHEAGHALLSVLIPDVDPLHKVSIIPRGTAALGYTLQLPLQDRYLMTKRELIGRLVVFLGGRASEEIAFNEVTTGAHNDLAMATQAARRMVCEFGMSEKLGHLTFGHRQQQVFLGRDIMEEKNYSEHTAVMIDQEVRKIIDGCYAEASSLLEKNRERLKMLAEALLEQEVLDSHQVRELLGLPAAPMTDEEKEKETPLLKEKPPVEAGAPVKKADDMETEPEERKV